MALHDSSSAVYTGSPTKVHTQVQADTVDGVDSLFLSMAFEEIPKTVRVRIGSTSPVANLVAPDLKNRVERVPSVSAALLRTLREVDLRAVARGV